MEKIIKLKPIKEKTEYYDKIEEKIKMEFKKEFYYPLLVLLVEENPKKLLKNSTDDNDDLKYALMSGRLYYSNGAFHGELSTGISKSLQKIGAKWDKKISNFRIKIEDLPMDIRSSISLASAKYEGTLKKIDDRLANFDTNEFSRKIDIHKYFDKTLYDVQKDFQKSIKNISVVPELTPEQLDRISKEWEINLQLDIKKFTDGEIYNLRAYVKDNVFLKGNRRHALIKNFQTTYNVTENKAKFWAKQETSLLMAKFKQTQYEDAGVDEYEWRCVHMPHQPTPQSIYKPGEVRYSHGILEGKIFSWNDPPCTTAPGQAKRYNNPGQDYNCRCFAIPIVRFK